MLRSSLKEVLFTVVSCCCPSYLATYLLKSRLVRFSSRLLSNCRLPRDLQLLRIVVHSGKCRRGLKRIIQPYPQIAIEEQLLPQ